jgi:hypothetical protein
MRVDASVASYVRGLRRLNAMVPVEEAQRLALAEFGPEVGAVSSASVKRIWRKAGLQRSRGGHRKRKVAEVEEAVASFSGGGGLAFLRAAGVETGVVEALATTMVEEIGLAVGAQANGGNKQDLMAEAERHRGESGRFTASYNQVLTSEADDPRWLGDTQKREHRDLSSLAVSGASKDVFAAKFLAMGAAGLLTDGRGFDGLAGPRGDWQAVLGGPAYAPATLDKFLAELGLLKVETPLWACHAANWVAYTRKWCDPDQRWVQQALYIDATTDPYWTQRYAASAKVSRTGRVQPALTRIALMGGAGVPLLVETHAGSASLAKTLLPSLKRLEESVGEGELGRLTVIDAEGGTLPMLTALTAQSGRLVVTVLKGTPLRSTTIELLDEVRAYGESGRLQEARVVVGGAQERSGSKGDLAALPLRGVQWTRGPQEAACTTLFVTNASAEEMTTEEVVETHRARWPNQERCFRKFRNGLGMHQSHGFGGGRVTHAAVETKLERAERGVARRQRALEQARAHLAALESLQASSSGEPASLLSVAVERQGRTIRSAAKSLENAEQELEKRRDAPREYYLRDTTREQVATCAKLTVYLLLEHVLREYFPQQAMEPRTFIEHFVSLPVTIRTRPKELLFEIHGHSRDAKRMDALRAACQVVTGRELKEGERRVRFEVKNPD